MDYDITRNDIDSWRASIKQAKPYEDYDKYNDNDYGNY